MLRRAKPWIAVMWIVALDAGCTQYGRDLREFSVVQSVEAAARQSPDGANVVYAASASHRLVGIRITTPAQPLAPSAKVPRAWVLLDGTGVVKQVPEDVDYVLSRAEMHDILGRGPVAPNVRERLWSHVREAEEGR